ncbi:MAG TPA: GNAT family N-acetyltransferase [Ktedonobacteraceae bacterium]|nr:GNAT family N-acetyltransferase [Ktedonobacteraceae bacterium]
MQFLFSLLDEVTAGAIQAWRYEGAYATYNMGSDDGDKAVEGMAELLDRRSPYYAVRDEQGELMGFFTVGTSALIEESNEPGIYLEDRTIAIGLGMRPDAMGKGMGLAFVQACLDFARQEFAPEHFQLYVFSWNKRAIRVYERAGFQHAGIVLQHNMHGDHEFLEMSRDA